MKISDTQRAVLERLGGNRVILYAQNWKDYHLWWCAICDIETEMSVMRVPTFQILHLIKLGFIELDVFYGVYRITPLGLTVIGKDK